MILKKKQLYSKSFKQQPLPPINSDKVAIIQQQENKREVITGTLKQSK